MILIEMATAQLRNINVPLYRICLYFAFFRYLAIGRVVKCCLLYTSHWGCRRMSVFLAAKAIPQSFIRPWMPLFCPRGMRGLGSC